MLCADGALAGRTRRQQVTLDRRHQARQRRRHPIVLPPELLSITGRVADIEITTGMSRFAAASYRRSWSASSTTRGAPTSWMMMAAPVATSQTCTCEPRSRLAGETTTRMCWAAKASAINRARAASPVSSATGGILAMPVARIVSSRSEGGAGLVLHAESVVAIATWSG